MSSLATSMFSLIAATCKAVCPSLPDLLIRSGCRARIFDTDLYVHKENYYRVNIINWSKYHPASFHLLTVIHAKYIHVYLQNGLQETV